MGRGKPPTARGQLPLFLSAQLNQFKSGKPLDRLICNAGIYQPSLDYAKWSEDGIEQTMQADLASRSRRRIPRRPFHRTPALLSATGLARRCTPLQPAAPRSASHGSVPTPTGQLSQPLSDDLPPRGGFGASPRPTLRSRRVRHRQRQHRRWRRCLSDCGSQGAGRVIPLLVIPLLIPFPS